MVKSCATVALGGNDNHAVVIGGDHGVERDGVGRLSDLILQGAYVALHVLQAVIGRRAVFAEEGVEAAVVVVEGLIGDVHTIGQFFELLLLGRGAGGEVFQLGPLLAGSDQLRRRLVVILLGLQFIWSEGRGD
jgi:hypothetical protein